MHVKLTSSKHLFDIWQETTYCRWANTLKNTSSRSKNQIK